MGIGQIQRRCAAYESGLPLLEYQPHQIWRRPAELQQTEAETLSKGNGDRVAVVLRTWDNYEYTEKRLARLRALIVETALQRGGKYQAYLLVNIKDSNADLEDDKTYEKFLLRVVLQEFRDMALLFNERTLKAWCPRLQEHGQAPSRVKWNWGFGEEADLISFMPMIDPIGTNWIYEDGVYGFAEGTATPRRAAIVSITRSSRRLLQLVSNAQGERGRWLVSEATLETFSLLHGLKAVTVPHPIYFADEMKIEELDAEINRGSPHSKAGGYAPSMLYMKGGWLAGPWWKASYWFTAGVAAEMWEAYVEGQHLPPMLLHSVKEK
ncbi:hypothetical protein Hte_001303 [Hypoxylon texense]